MAFASHGLVTAWRNNVSAADNAVRATFEAQADIVAAGAVVVYGDDEVWVRARHSAAGVTATGTVYFYDSANADGSGGIGNFMGTSPAVTLDATSLQDGSDYMSPVRTTANPGAAYAYLHLTTLSGGNADLYLGGRSSEV